eukprot:COSAG04_NODE_1708_length_5862_cov_2.503384_5_plen_106_part_00
MGRRLRPAASAGGARRGLRHVGYPVLPTDFPGVSGSEVMRPWAVWEGGEAPPPEAGRDWFSALFGFAEANGPGGAPHETVQKCATPAASPAPPAPPAPPLPPLRV